jgi:hypothetical protein
MPARTLLSTLVSLFRRKRSSAFPVCLVVAAFLLAVKTQSQKRGHSLATADTGLRVETRPNRIVIASLQSRQTRKEWIGAQSGQEAAAIPLIEQAEWEGKTARLTWEFVSSRVAKGPIQSLELTFVSRTPALELRSLWQARTGDGPIEHRIQITNREKTPVQIPLQPTLALSLRAPSGESLEHWWVEKGAITPTPYGTHHSPITEGYAANLFSIPYAREDAEHRDAIPWSAFQDTQDHQGLYVGIAFSGRVRIAVQRAEQAGPVLLEAGLTPEENGAAPFMTRLAPGETFETPPVFLGCYTGDVDDGANRLHRWVEKALRPPVHDARYPLLVNNSWGSGMAVDETLARRMIEETAELGLELFHIDAGWFRGVGDWHPHPAKFPDGLAPIADYAHSKGLKFGLWVGWTQGGIATDPTGLLANLSVFDPQMKDWFTRDYPPDWQPSDFTGADVCLADPRAADWCLRDLRRIVRDYKLDLLEHDQRMIVENCDRQDHRHTDAPTDIAYRAARGYYQVYDTLRAENPNLLFENCVNGGHTVDYGIVQRTHYISITDTYDPLSNRRAFYDASYALPPAMCESYVENWPARTLANFLYMLRSGMMGWCTIMTDTSQWNDAQHAAAKKQFALYKAWLRPLIAKGDLYHVSERPDGVRWDGMQYYDPRTGKGVLFAFRGTTDAERHSFRLKGLEPNARYKLVFTDGTSESTTRSGRDLMRRGIPVRLTEPQSSEIVTLTREK